MNNETEIIPMSAREVEGEERRQADLVAAGYCDDCGVCVGMCAHCEGDGCAHCHDTGSCQSCRPNVQRQRRKRAKGGSMLHPNNISISDNEFSLSKACLHATKEKILC